MTRASAADPRFDVRVGELRLRAVHRRLEAAVDADLDQPHQRRDVVRDARDEFLNRGGGRRVVALGDGGVGGELERLERRVGRLLGDVPGDHRDLVAPRRILGEQPVQDRQRFVGVAAAQLESRRP